MYIYFFTEIPGQYGQKFCKPQPEYHVKVTAFKPNVTIFASKQKPMKFSILGDDGKNYDFISKFGEDIRQDERVQQIFCICSQMFDNPMVTYKVVPINSNFGLIEFVKNTEKMENLIKNNPDINKEIFKVPFGVLNQNDLLQSSWEQRLRDHQNKIKDMIGEPTHLKNTFHQISRSFEGFHFLRNNFMISHAQVCAVSYILGIGDRHLQNMLVSLATGKSIAIDFGYSFGSAFSLPIPEIAPFRLTPQIQGLMDPFKRHGIFKDTMIDSLHKMEANQDVLMAALSGNFEFPAQKQFSY